VGSIETDRHEVGVGLVLPKYCDEPLAPLFADDEYGIAFDESYAFTGKDEDWRRSE